MAGIGGAKFLIITIDPGPAATDTPGAKLADGTRITVVAGDRVVHMDAPCPGVARVIRTKILVITIKRSPGLAHTTSTSISYGASVGIVTGSGVVDELATGVRVTTVIGAEVGVFALQVAATNAITEVTMVSRGADVGIITRHAVQQMQASHSGVTTIGGAEIIVIAIGGRRTLTASRHATIHQGAAIAIVACLIISHELATEVAMAGIIGAGITVGTGGCLTGNAQPVDTHIAHRADIAVLTGLNVTCVETPLLRVATIIGADIVVGANRGYSGHATPLQTRIPNGARISVATGIPIVVRRQLTFTTLGGANCFLADGIVAFRRSAFHYSFSEDDTLVWPLLRVAKQGAIAEVAIFKRSTIFVRLAITRNWCAGALTGGAEIPDGTRVAVIASCGIVNKRAATKAITGIVGAGIAVVTGDWRTGANSGFAMVADGTSITIDTLAFAQGLVDAAILSLAEVCGTGIAIIAGTDILPFHKDPLIHVTVAVVVHSVANLSRGLGGIAIA